MFCDNCGKKNEDTAKFCVNCGYKLEKKDIFSFDKDEFKIDPSDYEELKDYRKSKEDNKTENKEIKESFEKEEKKEFEEKNNLNSYSNSNRSINNSSYRNTFPIGPNKHFVDLIGVGKVELGIFALVFFVALVIFTTSFSVLISDGDLVLFPIILIFVFMLAIVFFIVAAMIKSSLDTKKAKIALKNGKTIQAEVINTFNQQNRKSYVYYIVYKYKINDIVHQTTQRVSLKTFDNIKNGDIINIKVSQSIGVYNENNQMF